VSTVSGSGIVDERRKPPGLALRANDLYKTVDK